MSGVTLRRVGHKGADHIAPGNTTASFDAALAARVDMIEFDVLPRDHLDPGGAPLILAHDYEHAPPDAVTLEEGLAHLASSQFADIELDVDLKLPGYERRVVEALRRHGLVERTIVSTLYMRSLVVLRELEPGLRLGWSVPRVRRDYTTTALTALPALGLLLRMRRRLPGIAAAHVHAGRCDAVMAHWRTVEAGADSGWRPLAEARRGEHDAGHTFTFEPRASGGAWELRGLVSYKWRRGDRVVRRERRHTEAGHPGTLGAEPAGFSAATCAIA